MVDTGRGGRAGDVRALERRFRLLVSAIGLPVVLIMALLVYREYRAAIDDDLAVHEIKAREYIAKIDALVTAADVYVAAMRLSMERSLARPADPASALPAGGDAVRDLAGAVPDLGFGRDLLAMALSDGVAGRPAAAAELRGTGELLPLQLSAHATQAYFRWSYFFSSAKDLVVIHPSAPIAALIGSDDQSETFRSYFDYPLYTLATPRENPGRNAVWAPVYHDAGGTGLMVSHTAPLYVDGVFRGIVGTDVLVKVVSDILMRNKAGREVMVLSDQRGHVIGDSLGRAAAAPEVLAASALLSFADADAVPGRFFRQGDAYVYAARIAGTPWRFLYAVDVAAVEGDALGDVVPYLAYLGLLVLALIASNLVLVRIFVRPAFRLLHAVEALDAGRAPVLSGIPPLWRPWFNRIVALFSSLAGSLRNEAAAAAKSRAVIDVALDGVVTADRDGIIRDFNPAAAQMFGLAAGEATGRTIGAVMVPDAHRAGHEAGMARMKRGGPSRILGGRVEITARHSDGHSFPVELQIHEVTDIGDIRYVAYVRDLTAQHAAAEALERQRQKLYQAEKLSAMGSLLTGLAHELNNPLSVVIGQSAMVEAAAGAGAARERVVKIRLAAERCGRIVKTFLAMARQQTPERSLVLLGDLVRTAAEMLSYGLRSAGVTVEVEDAGTRPVEADADQLSQVIINLIVNAEQAFGDRAGTRLIRICIAEEGDEALLSVEDNGPGVPAALKARIFEAFFTTKPVGVGTGVGLAVSANIVAAHGGTLTVGDRPGGGAVFSLRLPLAPAEAAKAPPPPEEAAPPGAASGAVLIVDDEPDIAEILADVLETDGYRPQIAGSVAEGVRHALENAYALIFCDLRMPGGGGTAFWKAVTAARPAAARRIVFVTGDTVSGPDLIAEATGRENAVILEKPFSREAIRKAIADLATL
ncbi:ATP-binding protein [Ensifer soli]|uniref:ATP-binding protein n=1 Tax=Ciceribacter sp. sgz301302 TaxID=3342379 RepID=UPI0035B8797B